MIQSLAGSSSSEAVIFGADKESNKTTFLLTLLLKAYQRPLSICALWLDVYALTTANLATILFLYVHVKNDSIAPKYTLFGDLQTATMHEDFLAAAASHKLFSLTFTPF